MVRFDLDLNFVVSYKTKKWDSIVYCYKICFLFVILLELNKNNNKLQSCKDKQKEGVIKLNE